MDRQQIIAAVARETGVKLSPADPILAAVAVNQIMLDQALAKLDQQVQAQANRVTAASTQAVVDAKREAELLLTEGGIWFEARIKAAGEAAAALVLANLRQETARAERASRQAVRAAWVAAAGGLVFVCGLAGVFLGSLGHP